MVKLIKYLVMADDFNDSDCSAFGDLYGVLSRQIRCRSLISKYLYLRYSTS